MIINVAIIEDDNSQVSILNSFLKEFENANDIKFNIQVFNNGLSFLDDFKSNFDLILLDIDMPYMNGMELSHKIRKLDEEVLIIFETNLAQFAIKGYEVNALDFIVKPMDYKNFAFKLKRATNIISSRKKDFLLIQNEHGSVKVAISNITYIEVFRHTIIYHFKDGAVIKNYGSLTEIESKLNTMGFFKCNRCYLVNLKYVDKIVDNYLYIGNEKLLISRPQKQKFIEALNNFIGSGMNV